MQKGQKPLLLLPAKSRIKSDHVCTVLHNLKKNSTELSKNRSAFSNFSRQMKVVKNRSVFTKFSRQMKVVKKTLRFHIFFNC